MRLDLELITEWTGSINVESQEASFGVQSLVFPITYNGHFESQNSTSVVQWYYFYSTPQSHPQERI